MTRYFVIAALAVMAAAAPALAADTAQQTVMKDCSAKWSAMSAADKGKTKRTEFMSGCMKAPASTAASGGMMMKPTAMSGPAMRPAAAGSMAMTAKPATGSMAKASTGGSAKCKDGTTVTYKNRKGTCSGHGGVASWM